MSSFPTFEAFFAATHGGREPYAWQSELAGYLREHGRWPWHLDVPTGLGKTTAIAIAVYELARQLDTGQPRTMPQRIFHVVDRRAIIDSTADYIAQLSKLINEAEAAPLTAVRQALSSLNGPGEDSAVATASVHGLHTRGDDWLRATGCVIVTLTSHQFVSRLLFRGYGVTSKSRPINAGLCAIDRLVLFDEPHLSEQSVYTILATEQLQARAEQHLGAPPSQTVLLGATVPARLASLSREKLSLDPTREASREARLRLGARREGRITWTDPADAKTMKALVAAARRARESGARRVAVFANTVGMAQAVYRTLGAGDGPLVLLTSRFRAADRPNDLPDEGTVVATQTLEVGADESFDAIVTEVASWAALTQRLGRLNRDGRSTHGVAEIVASWDEASDAPAWRESGVAVYGERAMGSATALLRRLEAEGEGWIDFGAAALHRIRDRAEFDQDALAGDRRRIGTLTSSMLSSLAQTRPTPVPDVPVDALITGPDASDSHEVSVAWRARLDVFDTDEDAPRVNAAEFVSIPRSALALFLSGKKSSSMAALHDAIGGYEGAETFGGRSSDMSLFRVWDVSSERWRRPTQPADIFAAPEVLMDPRSGGYDRHRGWTGDPSDSATELDISMPTTLQELLRLSSSRTGGSASVVFTRESLRELAERRPDIDTEALRNLFAEYAEQVPDGAQLDDLEAQELVDAALDIARVLVPTNLWEITERGRCADAVVVRFKRAMWNEESCVPTPLAEHQRQVGAWAKSDARAAGLEPVLVDAIRTAGRHHDDGKARLEFQEYLGIEDGAKNPVAKSGRAAPQAREHSWLLQAGLERYWRHEVESVVYNRELPPLERHLIGSHHGWFRPIVRPVAREGYPDPLAHAGEFAQLNRRYGIWGLAYLEAVLRLADQRASRLPQDVPADVDTLAEEQRVSDQSASEGAAATRDRGVIADGDSRRAGERSADADVTTGQRGTRLTGLHTHPLTGWFATVGLLASAAREDPRASLRWEGLDSEEGSLPLVPVLHTSSRVDALVQRILTDPCWNDADQLVAKHLGRPGLTAKNQKLPSAGLHDLLIEAEASGDALVLGLVNDLARVEASARLPLQIAPLPNNASYPAIAFGRVQANNDALAAAIVDAQRALLTTVAGFADDQCDGGMDRSLAVTPAVNGNGHALKRQSRSALAPLALFGIAALGTGPLRGIGVSKRSGLVLPLPTTSRTFDELRSLAIAGHGIRSSDWNPFGLDWVYGATVEKLSQYESVWRGSPRSHANQMKTSPRSA